MRLPCFVGKMRVSFVPQIVQAPCRSGFPFLMVIWWASFISRFSLHLTQYDNSAIVSSPLVTRSCLEGSDSHHENTGRSIAHAINRIASLCATHAIMSTSASLLKSQEEVGDHSKPGAGRFPLLSRDKFYEDLTTAHLLSDPVEPRSAPGLEWFPFLTNENMVLCLWLR